MIAYVSSPSHPASFYLMDLTTNKADLVGEEYPGLASAQLGEVRVVSYTARDGTTIPAYLTLPPGGLEKDLPLVVLPHGGPEDRDDFAFDWWPQFIATRGYAVLQPQYRGSTGFGDAFRLAGRKQWGGLMQDDVTDGVKWLINQGVADPHRVCIVGSSYGGYAALAGAAFTPELYACAASINGITNLPELGAYARDHFGSDSFQVGYWRDDIGSPRDPEVAARSPLNAVENIRSPVMLMYSTDDTVVPPSQSEAMAHALQRNGKDFSLVTLGGDDHWLSRSATRVKILKELDSFLAKNLRN
jgi:dipeptidyl aminopeptidase/acylaminoacyl peptidase